MQSVTENQILAIRKFNRFYTKHLGLLHRRLMESSYSLVEARVLYEIAQNKNTTASAILAELELDQGYLSRILKRFEEQALIKKEPCPDDARSSRLILTKKGSEEADMMAEKSGTDILSKLGALSQEQVQEMVQAMHTIEETLESDQPSNRTAIIRSHRTGDIGWVIERHGTLYREEYGFNEYFEALCSRIASDFLSSYDPKREHCWIAEVDGERMGCVFLVKEDDETAKLRLLLVDPRARGLGLGKRLVRECVEFAKHAGYKRMVLWTNDGLSAARKIYENEGFKLQSEEWHDDFGVPQTGQYWALGF